MTGALLIIDVQKDFTEGGALAVAGGAGVANRISDFLNAIANDSQSSQPAAIGMTATTTTVVTSPV